MEHATARDDHPWARRSSPRPRRGGSRALRNWGGAEDETMAKPPTRRAASAPLVDTTHERAMLERHLLRRRTGPLFPGLWAGDHWTPGVRLADTWTLAWSAAGMPMLEIPVGFSIDHVARALGILPPAARLSTRQRKEWKDAGGGSPEETWQQRVRQPIGNPLLALLASSMLDDLAIDHAQAPIEARKLYATVIRAVRILRRQLNAVPRRAAVSISDGRWHVGSLRHLLDLYVGDILAALTAVQQSAAPLDRLGRVRRAFAPQPRRRVQPWIRPAARLDSLVRVQNAGQPDLLAVVAGLELHGHDLGAGTLAQKQDRIRRALRRVRTRRQPRRRPSDC